MTLGGVTRVGAPSRGGVLQPVARVRAMSGEHAASAVWDTAIVKIVLGGGFTAGDLDDRTRLPGQRQQVQSSSSMSGDGRRTVSTSTARVPVLEPHLLRTLTFGTALLLLRSDKPDHPGADAVAGAPSRRAPAAGTTDRRG